MYRVELLSNRSLLKKHYPGRINAWVVSEQMKYMKNQDFFAVTYSTKEYERLNLGGADFPNAFDWLSIERGNDISHISLPTLTHESGGFADYQISIIGDICSLKLKNIIEQNKSATDLIEWHEIVMESTELGRKVYYLLHFPILFPVLDIEKSRFVDSPQSTVAKFCLQFNSVKGHHIFARPNAHSGFMVSSSMKEKIEAEGCTGLYFYPIEVSF